MRIVPFVSLFTLLFFSNAYAAFDITPIVATLSPTGSGANASFVVQNGDDTKLPVQISIVHRNPDADGKEVHKDTPDIDDMFQVYPAQLVLGPKERRTVRVTWIGETKPKREIPFRIIAEELPIDMEAEKTTKRAVARVRIATKYIGSLYIMPPGAHSELVAKATPTNDKNPKLMLEIENIGTTHRVLAGMKMKLTSVATKTDYEFPAQQLQRFNSENVLAGRTRRYTMDWPSGFPVGPVKVALDLPKE